MKLPLIFASVLTALLPVVAPSSGVTQTSGEIAGIYHCEGTRPDGAAYKGTVEIARNNGTYQLLWTFGPREHYLGFGIVSGDVLAVSVFGGMPGVVAYRIEQSEKGPRLVGQWAVPDPKGQVFTETLTKREKGAAAPHVPEPPRGRRVPAWAIRAT
jgi:hypothetical protein